MYSSKNFINIEALVNNSSGIESPLGELTTNAQTFTRNLGVYQNPSQPGYTLFNFSSFSSAANSGAGGPVVLDASVVNQAIDLVKFCLNITQTTSGQIYADELLNQLTTHATSINAHSVSIGPVHHYTNVNGIADLWMPTSISWTDDTLTDTDNHHQVWIDVAAFTSEYSEYEIVVVPPLTPLDQFFTTGQNVANLISAKTVSQIIDDIQASKDDHPETIVRSDTYNYINPLNPSQTVPVNWPVLIYGPAGDNIDSIKDALMNYILAHSSHTRSEWTTIFPDIFKRTEFIIVPQWQSYAIPNMTLLNGVYSPVVVSKDIAANVAQFAPEYLLSHIADNVQTTVHPYRSISLAIIGGADNRNGWFKFTDVFPDYISVPTTSADFNRMTSATQQFVQLLANLIIKAEEMDEFTTMPPRMMKITRNGILYAAATFNNIQYLVASRKSVYSVLNYTGN